MIYWRYGGKEWYEFISGYLSVSTAQSPSTIRSSWATFLYNSISVSKYLEEDAKVEQDILQTMRTLTRGIRPLTMWAVPLDISKQNRRIYFNLRVRKGMSSLVGLSKSVFIIKGLNRGNFRWLNVVDFNDDTGSEIAVQYYNRETSTSVKHSMPTVSSHMTFVPSSAHNLLTRMQDIRDLFRLIYDLGWGHLK
jgi:hypothetical protein